MGAIQKLEDKYYTQTFHSTNPHSKSKGVSIMLHKNAGLVISQQYVDSNGRFLCLKGQWKGTPITLAKVYIPNSAQVSFCQHLVEQLKGFAQGCIILGGDFNLSLNPSQDTSDGTSSLPYKKKTLLTSLALVDP